MKNIKRKNLKPSKIDRFRSFSFRPCAPCEPIWNRCLRQPTPSSMPCKSLIQQSKSELTRRGVSRPGSPLAVDLAQWHYSASKRNAESGRRRPAEEAHLLVVLRALPVPPTRGSLCHWQLLEAAVRVYSGDGDQLEKRRPPGATRTGGLSPASLRLTGPW